MRGFDEHGQPQEAQLSGLAARIAQHELDHLDGRLGRLNSTAFKSFFLCVGGGLF